MDSNSDNETLMKLIQESRKKLQKKLNDVDEIVSNIYFDFFYYFIIIGIMMFFLYIILGDLYKTLKLYNVQNEDTKRTSFRKNSKKSIYQDDNEYIRDDDISINVNSYIQDGFSRRNKSFMDEFDKLLNFKVENKIDDKIHTGDINTTSIYSKFDDYEYSSKKKNSSFWNMLFEKPKHHSLVNNSEGGFFEFI